MTSDELRDRIEYILESHAHMAMDQQACAIIDEFGLTAESGKVMGDGHDFPGADGVRVVGKWEKQ